MKRSSPADIAYKKRRAWLERTMAILSIDEDAAQQLLSLPRQQSVRINTLSADVSDPDIQASPWIGEPYAWLPEGFTLTAPVAEVRDDPLITSGKVFIQNAASWLPVLALDAQPSELVLDVCAAPGGKTSHIAARTHNQAHIWANDNSRARLAKLQATMERLGAKAERFTLYDAQRLAQKMPDQQFDKILLDAPCSGEGLMTITNDKDLATWSVAHIKRLQQLQKRLIVQAWQLLKPGGTLVYSTCTMAPEENEAVIDYLLRSQRGVKIQPILLDLPNRVPTVRSWNGKVYNPATQQCLRLQPSIEAEAFFVCKLHKLALTESEVL